MFPGCLYVRQSRFDGYHFIRDISYRPGVFSWNDVDLLFTFNFYLKLTFSQGNKATRSPRDLSPTGSEANTTIFFHIYLI